jgi:hypothetical protein
MNSSNIPVYSIMYIELTGNHQDTVRKIERNKVPA